MMIHETGQKIKAFADIWLKTWGISIFVFLLGLASFGLGRLSYSTASRPVVSVALAATAVQMPAMTQGGVFVASRTGTVYYYPWCTAATKISTANQRWFKTEKEAQNAGYRAAKNCKGLTASSN